MHLVWVHSLSMSVATHWCPMISARHTTLSVCNLYGTQDSGYVTSMVHNTQCMKPRWYVLPDKSVS